jgi:hypothetical protein
MEIIRYKTNIPDDEARLRVAPYLNNAIGPANWRLDLNSYDKILIVYSPVLVNEEQVLNAVRMAGYRAASLDDYNSVF